MQGHAWNKYGGLINKYLQLQRTYSELAGEVAYILNNRLKDAAVELAIVSHRAKTVGSLIDKVMRKPYKNPLDEITDLAGVRVVHLYRSDFTRIAETIRNEFEVREEIHKIAEKSPDSFGYVARHFVVRLHNRCCGARYDDLKGLDCEIQVRTILQDAWALVDEHMAYKKAKDIPSELRRKLNSLAGVFETADDQFDRIKTERDEYLNAIQAATDDLPSFLNREVNADTLTVFLRWRYPDLPLGANSRHISVVLSMLDPQRYPTLSKLEELLQRTSEAFAAYQESDKDWNVSAAGILAVCLALEDKHLRTEAWEQEALERLEQVEHLVAT